jgi:hypothetical protein
MHSPDLGCRIVQCSEIRFKICSCLSSRLWNPKPAPEQPIDGHAFLSWLQEAGSVQSVKSVVFYYVPDGTSSYGHQGPFQASFPYYFTFSFVFIRLARWIEREEEPSGRQ